MKKNSPVNFKFYSVEYSAAVKQQKDNNFEPLDPIIELLRISLFLTWSTKEAED